MDGLAHSLTDRHICFFASEETVAHLYYYCLAWCQSDDDKI